MFKRTTATIILIAFFSTLVPAPAAFALRQEVADGSAIGAMNSKLHRKKVPGTSQTKVPGTSVNVAAMGTA